MKPMAGLTVAALALAVVASIFAIWPVVADAPWEDDTPAVVDDGPKFSEAEVVALVRGRVNTSSCESLSRFWEAEYQGDGVWIVGSNCGRRYFDLDATSTITAVWSFHESGERLIPLTGFARRFMP